MDYLKGQVYNLRKINPDSWAGIRLYSYANEDIGPAIDKQGLPVTGLTEDVFKTNAKGNKEITKGTRKLLEEEMQLDEGTLKKGSLIKHSQFWINFVIRVGEGDLSLNTDIAEDTLKVLFLKAQPQIAFGVKSIKASSKYVLFTAEEEAKQSNTKKRSRRDAYRLFEELTLKDRIEILEMTGVKTLDLTPDVIEDRLSDYMEEYPAKFTAMVKDPARKNKTFVRECLNKGILTMEDGAVMYNEVVLGFDISSATNSLFSDEQAKTRQAIKLQIDDLKKVKR